MFWDPAIASNALSQGEVAVQTPLTSGEKTKLIGPGDIALTSNDSAWGSIFSAHEYFDDPLGDYYLYYTRYYVNPYPVRIAYHDGGPFGSYTDYASNPVIRTYDVNGVPAGFGMLCLVEYDDGVRVTV